MKVRVRCGARDRCAWRRRWWSRSLAVLISVVGPTMLTAAGHAQETATFFRRNCINCHTIGGGRLVGPDLKGITKQRDRIWFIRFLQNPKLVIEGGDTYALKLRDEARGVIMPTVPGMTPERAEALLQLIEAESALEHSHFEGMRIPDTPFTATDVARGKALFSGRKRLSGGGPPCGSCHTTASLGGLGGGRLGPDLSRVFERLHGRKGLASWLLAPASTTMRAIFTEQAMRPEEILSLVAFLEDSAKQGADDDRPQGLELLLLGLGGLALCVVSFDAIWKGRLRSVRRALVEGRGSRGDR